mmetsp:Transcript_45092/g.113564  ORF Transcript_45092/g.113564 Transcript_45092/m.113564 type:complete len:205 (-) Transcript_45092:131-745(-)
MFGVPRNILKLFTSRLNRIAANHVRHVLRILDKRQCDVVAEQRCNQGNLSGYLNALRGSPASAAALCTCIIAWYLEGTPAQRDAIDRLSQQLWLQQTTNNVAIPVPTVANPAVVLPTVANPVAVLPTVAAPPIVAHEEPPVPVLVPLNNPPFNIGECAICFEESCPVPVFCAQCQRAAMCAQCAVLIADSTARCPFCRGPMTPP